MKPYLILITAAAFFTLASCGGNKQQAPTEQPPTTSGSSLMKEGPAYDPTKINPNAPVVEITLRARGNSMADMNYDQPELKVKAGTTVKLTLINESKDASMSHNFMLIQEGTSAKVGPEAVKAGVDNNYIPKMKEVLVATKMTKPGEKTDLTFPAPDAGSYDFICSYPGHYTRMNGKFKVEGGS